MLRPIVYSRAINPRLDELGQPLPLGWHYWHKEGGTYLGPLPNYRAAYLAWCDINGRLPVKSTKTKRPVINVTAEHTYIELTRDRLPDGWHHWHKAEKRYVGPFRSYRDAYNAWCVANGQLPVIRKTRQPASPHAADLCQRKALPALDMRHDAALPDDIRDLLDKPY